MRPPATGSLPSCDPSKDAALFVHNVSMWVDPTQCVATFDVLATIGREKDDSCNEPGSYGRGTGPRVVW